MMSELLTVPCFIGEYSHSIDKKGRIIIPAKFRETLQGKVFVTRGLDGCLMAYTLEQFAKLAAQINAMPNTKRAVREYKRLVLGPAAECEIDNQGRILLPANLIDMAKLDKDCVVVGTGNAIEIWSKELWEAYNSDHLEDIEDVAESLTDFLV